MASSVLCTRELLSTSGLCSEMLDEAVFSSRIGEMEEDGGEVVHTRVGLTSNCYKASPKILSSSVRTAGDNVSQPQDNESFTLGERLHCGFHLSSYIAGTVVETLPSSTYVILTDTNFALFHLKNYEAVFDSCQGEPCTPADSCDTSWRAVKVP